MALSSSNLYVSTSTTSGPWDYWKVDSLPYRSPSQPVSINLNAEEIKSCCKSIGETIIESKKKENEIMMNTNMFNGIFGKIAPGMCRLSMSGKIAIKTSNGYKAYDVESGRLTNCDSFAFDIGEDFFFVIPTNKVERGDIILVSGKPRCVLSVDKNLIKTMNYEDGSIQDIVPERHMFMGKQFFYGKIITMFGEMGAGSGDKGMKQMMKFMMLKEMMGGTKTEGGLGSVLPMMAMMGGMGGNFFDGMFDFGDGEEEESEEK